MKQKLTRTSQVTDMFLNILIIELYTLTLFSLSKCLKRVMFFNPTITHVCMFTESILDIYSAVLIVLFLQILNNQ